MGRPPGRRNADHDRQRDELARRCLAALATPDGSRLSLRDLAKAAAIAPTTLRHYFTSREALIAHALEVAAREQAPLVQKLATGKATALRPSAKEILRLVARAFSQGSAAHVVGLASGLAHPVLGPAYVGQLLDPVLEAVALRLDRHRLAGHLAPGDVETAALALVSPILVALVHQRALGGGAVRRLSLERLADLHARRWAEAWARPARVVRA